MNKLGRVQFPDVQGERHYMVPFFKDEGLPIHLKHWQRPVDQMLDGIDTEAPIFLMVDQGFVRSGETLRRPGAHVDGHWMYDPNPKRLYAHGSRSGGHGGHGGYDPTRRYGNDVPPARKKPVTPKRIKKEKDKDDPGDWNLDGAGYDETIILASNIAGCIAYEGLGPFGNNRGDCSHIDVSGMRSDILVDGHAFGIDAFQLHAPTPMQRPGYRTLLRLNVPGVAL